MITSDNLRQFEIALAASECGARPSVIAKLTGLPQRRASRMWRKANSPGGPMTGLDGMLFSAPLICRVEAVLFANLFDRLRCAGHSSTDALLTAFQVVERDYQPLFHERGHRERATLVDCLNFDRAFLLASDLRTSCPSDEASWLQPKPRFSLAPCPQCKCRAVVDDQRLDCPVCRLLARCDFDIRLTHFRRAVDDRVDEFRNWASNAFRDRVVEPPSARPTAAPHLRLA